MESDVKRKEIERGPLNHISSTSKDEKRVSVESVDVDDYEFQNVTAIVDLVLSSRRSQRVLGNRR